MTLSPVDLAYFERGSLENPRFWARFGEKPDLRGAAVLDVGCGHGSLCVDAARSGARRVLGLDLSAGLITFASENVRVRHPQWAGVVEFRCQDVRETPEDGFDVCISKDTFEHVMELPQVLAAIGARLRTGGRLYAGFGPLWNSPFGDHGRTEVRLPWGHVLLPERYLIRRLNRRWKDQVGSIRDLGLNQLALADYLSILRQAAPGLRTVALCVNASTHPLSKLFSLARRAPIIGEYFAHNLYCILQKEPE